MSEPTQPQAGGTKQAISHLLDREPPAEYLREWTERIGAEKPAAEPETRTGFLFRAGAEWLALPAHVLHEIGERTAIHSLPHRRAGALLGLTSVRGELLLCISLEMLLGLEKTSDAGEEGQPAAGGILVASWDGDRFAFPVNEIHGMHRYHPRELRPVPATLSKATSYMTGVLVWKNGTVGCLNDELLLQALSRELS